MSDTQKISKSELWKDRINSWHTSGLSQKDWCAENQIPLSTFRWWVKRLADSGRGASIPEETVFAKLPSEAELTQALGSAPVTISIEGIRIGLSTSCPRDMMRDLIWALKANA